MYVYPDESEYECKYVFYTSQQACWCLHPGGQNVDGREPIVLKMYKCINL